MDEFAQTRGADDLFDDEIVPVSEEQSQPEPQVEEEPVATTEIDTPPPPRVDTPSRSRGGERRGRGRGRGRGGRGGSQNPSQKRNDATAAMKSVDSTSQHESENADESARDTPDTTEQGNKPEVTADSKSAAGGEGQRVPAVRGDRSATGGIKKPKLTEEELSRRIAAAKENAAKVAAAHARAAADQASFLEREKVAEAKRREELQHRRVMDSERERNRQRKLQAQTGREWDAEKQEETFSGRGGRQFRRGMHGGVSGYTRRDFGDSPGHEEVSNSYSHHGSPRGRGRGRGGRGRGGARGQRDVAATDEQPEAKATPTPVIDNEADFPALPGGQKQSGAIEAPSDPDVRKAEASLSPVSATGATWADQVESG
ncbi:hypothetical protein BDV59DRAFT_128705 [Aspergillus ambiguus]|uniref:uncharacterized protein n=1 Tax=Aspergillus ambiguus TaxID=176160 RepID=UPI003CCD99CF